jgi:hypothetical protein
VGERDERGTRTGLNGASGSQAARRHALAEAAAPWLRRGYELRYQDDQLVQVGSRVTGPTASDLLLAGGVALAAAVAGALGVLGYLHLTRRGRWHIVSLVLTPDRGVLAHQQWKPVSEQR